MVVTAGTLHSQSHHSPGNDVDEIVDDVMLVVQESSAQGQVPQGGQRPLVLSEGEPVGGDLVPDKSVERKIIVERVDDVVTVGIGEGVFPLGGEYVSPGVGVARHIEPVAAPALPVASGGEETLDNLFPCIGRVVALKGVHLRRGGGESEEIEGGSPQQLASVGRESGFHAGAAQSLEHKEIYWVERPVVFAGGRLGIEDFLECPMSGGLLAGSGRWGGGVG